MVTYSYCFIIPGVCKPLLSMYIVIIGVKDHRATRYSNIQVCLHSFWYMPTTSEEALRI